MNTGQFEELGVAAGSLRFLADAAGSRSWAATNSDDEVCLVVEGPGTSGLAGSACRTTTDFFQSGTSLRLEDGTGDGVVVHMLPPDVSSATAQDSVSQAVEQSRVPSSDDPVVPGSGDTAVVVLSAVEADALGEVRIPRDGGHDLVLRTLTAP